MPQIKRIKMKHLILLPFLFVAIVSTIKAETVNDSVLLTNGYVYDGFTEEVLEKAKVTIYDADSVTVLVDSLPPWYSKGTNWNTGVETRFFAGFSAYIPRRKVYVVRASYAGYAPQTVRIELPEKQMGTAPRKWMLPKFYLWHAMQYDLGEASVQGSKILMVMKGDTLVYNASAFNLAEGSMLDNLVRALPGVKLEDGGRITVNGEFVKSLLVNGRDFFKGDPQIALANLPAYTVDKVKVYRKAPDWAKYHERPEAEKKDDPLVMDVNLKREYAQGWIANVEAGGGSRLGDGFDPVWMGRLFALRYTNHSSLGVYGTINNMDDYERPGSKGEWKRTEPGQGRRVTKMGGVDFSIDGKKTGIKFQTDLQAMRQTINNEARTTSEDFLPSGGSLYRQSQSASREGTTDLKWNASLDILNLTSKKYVSGLMYIYPSAYYTRTTSNGTNGLTQFEADTARTAAIGGGAFQPLTDVLYRRNVLSNAERKAWGGQVKVETYLGMPFGLPALDIHGSASYNRRDNTSFRTDQIVYAEPGQTDFGQLRRNVQPEMDYAFNILVAPNKSVKLFPKVKRSSRLGVDYEYKQTFRSGHRDLDTCRLDDDGLQPPSATTPAQWLADERNSFHTTRMERTHRLKPLVYSIPIGPLTLGMEFPLEFTKRRIHDFRGGNDRVLMRDDFRWEGDGRLNWWSENGNIFFDANYHFSQGLPDIFSLLDVRDDSDPLVISEGNSQLKLSRTHTVTVNFNYREKEHQRLAAVYASYRKADRQVATARWYDLTTGVTRLRPENIDGNWDASLRLHYNQALGRYDRWTIEGDATGRFLHSVDFASDNLDAPLPDRVAVDNLSFDASLRTDYRFKQWHAGAKMEVKHTRLDSRDEGFTPMDYTDFSAGVTLTAPLFWGIDLETDVMAYLRRGYTDASMNTTDWVWNASLSKALGRRKQWLVRAVGFDLLQQLSRVTRTVNSQGRTETWYNTVPAYASLHLTYRFDMKPKKKAGARE